MHRPLRNRLALAAAAIFLAATLAATGCATYGEPEGFGDSVRLAVEMQTLNPGPAGDAPVEGLDGRHAAQAMRNYHQGPPADDCAASDDGTSRFGIGGSEQ
jgi:hypothetical protein